MVSSRKWIAALMVLALLPAFSRASDESEIKDAANAFGLALSKGDAAAAKKVATSDDPTVGFIDSVAPMIGASNKLNDAAIAKYGDDGRNVSMLAGVATNLANLTKLSNEAQVKVTGDTATVEPAKNAGADQSTGRAMRGGRGPQNIHFRKEGGKWKVDLSNSATTRGDNGNFQAMTQAFSETADEIKAGKYPTADEARQALTMKIVAAARNGRRRGQ